MTPSTAPERRVGRYLVEATPNRLTLSLDNRGDFALKAGLFFVFAMGCLLLLAVLAVVVGRDRAPSEAPAPALNPVGFIWAVGTVGMFVILPVYFCRNYRAPVTFTFEKVDGTVRRDGSIVCRFDRAECIRLDESRDPDGRFLYDVALMWGDGRELLLQSDYDERAAMNLANEIAAFVGVEVRWR